MSRNLSDMYFYDNMLTGSVAALSSSSQLLVPDSRDRKCLTIVSDSPDIVFLRYSADASSQNFQHRLAAYSSITLPTPVYTGPIYFRCGSSTGSVKFVELS